MRKLQFSFALFFTVALLRGNSQLREQVLPEFVPYVDQLLDVLDATDRALDYTASQKAHLNVDGVVGPRMVSDQLRVFLERHGGDLIFNSSSDWKDLLTRLEALRLKSKGVADDAVHWVRISQPDYFNLVGNVLRDGLWALDYPTSSLTDPSSHRKGTVLLPVLPVHIDECINEVLGTSDTWPAPCNISDTCWTSMTRSGDTSYPLTHQVLYLEIGETSGCGKELKLLSPNNTGPMLEKFCRNVLTEAEGIEYSGFPETHQDLFAEQIALCGFLGYKEFFQPDWVQTILSWQEPGGCFVRQDFKEHRAKREDRKLEGGCSSHKTAVALGAYVVAIRSLTEILLDGERNNAI